MGVNSFAQEYKSPVAADRMFKALILDSHKLIPKLPATLPIKSVEVVEGDGGVGTIKRTQYAHGSELKYMKHIINDIDTEKFMCKYSLIEGELLGDHLESITYVMKFVPSSDGGSIIISDCEYHTKGDIQLSEKELKHGKEMPTDSPNSSRIIFLLILRPMPNEIMEPSSRFCEISFCFLVSFLG